MPGEAAGISQRRIGTITLAVLPDENIDDERTKMQAAQKIGGIQSLEGFVFVVRLSLG